MELLRKFRPLYLARERWFGDLIQRLAYGVISQAFTRWALAYMFMRVLFIVGESLAWRGSWPSPIVIILFIIRGNIRTGGSSFLPCMVQLLFLVINLLLHGFVAVLPLGYVTSHSGVASACMGGMHTALSISLTISFPLKIKKIILLLRICGLCLIWTWFYHV